MQVSPFFCYNVPHGAWVSKQPAVDKETSVSKLLCLRIQRMRLNRNTRIFRVGHKCKCFSRKLACTCEVIAAVSHKPRWRSNLQHNIAPWWYQKSSCFLNVCDSFMFDDALVGAKWLTVVDCKSLIVHVNCSGTPHNIVCPKDMFLIRTILFVDKALKEYRWMEVYIDLLDGHLNEEGYWLWAGISRGCGSMRWTW